MSGLTRRSSECFFCIICIISLDLFLKLDYPILHYRYMRQYLELWVMFDTIDESEDNTISFQEFRDGLDLLR